MLEWLAEHIAEPLTLEQAAAQAHMSPRTLQRRFRAIRMKGDAANHAWGVMDVLATTTFPDIRAKCIIHSAAGSMLPIPREGGHLFRMYVDLGEQPADGNGEIRKTPIEDIIKGAQAIVHPYDKAWSTLMATKSDALESPDAVEDFYMRTAEFPAGFMTEYPPSLLIGSGAQQELATGFPLGKRFKSSLVERVNDGNPIHLGHKHMADGRWRIYVLADAAAPGTGSATDKLGEWLSTAPRWPLAAQPADGDTDAWFDVKVVYQQPHLDVDINAVPQALKPPAAMRQLGREFDA